MPTLICVPWAPGGPSVLSLHSVSSRTLICLLRSSASPMCLFSRLPRAFCLARLPARALLLLVPCPVPSPVMLPLFLYSALRLCSLYLLSLCSRLCLYILCFLTFLLSGLPALSKPRAILLLLTPPGDRCHLVLGEPASDPWCWPPQDLTLLGLGAILPRSEPRSSPWCITPQ